MIYENNDILYIVLFSITYSQFKPENGKNAISTIDKIRCCWTFRGIPQEFVSLVHNQHVISQISRKNSGSIEVGYKTLELSKTLCTADI
jgi:hypothetical protein